MDMKAVVIYEKSALGGEAIAMLKQASGRADASAQWSVKPWRLELLCLPVLAEESLREALDAQLIVLALFRQPDVPVVLLHWLDRWAARRHVQDAALALVEGSTGGSLALSAAPELVAFAEKNGLTFIFGDGVPTSEASEVLGREAVWQDKSWTSSPLYARGELAAPAHRNWGLNE